MSRTFAPQILQINLITVTTVITLITMFARLLRPLFRKLLTPRTLLTTTAIVTYSLLKTPLLLDSPEHTPEQQARQAKRIEQYIRKLQSVQVCQDKDLLQGQRKIVTVKDHNGFEHKIIVIRKLGKLYAFLGSCPHTEPFDNESTDYSLEHAMVFNDKLYCPHHGCVYDVKSGSIEYGPSLYNLPIFLAEQKQGIVKLLYPSAIPTSIEPDMTERDVQDLRKVVILGGDDAATVGCLNSLRQFGYQGEITVVKEGPINQPYKKQYLHKKMLNLHLNDSPAAQTQPEPKQDKQKQQAQQTSQKQSKQPKKKAAKQDPAAVELQIRSFITEQLQQKIYSKLRYYPQSWYENYGVDFIFSDQAYRIINKQYYPYVTFVDGTKVEFDTLLCATGLTQKIPSYQGITTDEERDIKIHLPENVFCPLRSKEQHLKLNTFLNTNIVKSLLVMGYSMESLEFVEALKHEFPDIKVTVIDNQKSSAITEFIGPDIQKAITKQFKSRGVDFFIKVRDQLLFSNKFSTKNLQRKALRQSNNPQQSKKGKLPEPQSKLKYQDAVTVRFSDDSRIKADGVVIFPNQFSGNIEWIKNGKYTDFDFVHEHLGGDPFCRTDNIRIFSAGLSSANEYFLLTKRLIHTDPNTAYEQGFNVGINMQALRIPFTYVPYQRFSFFGKQFYYTGTHDFFDSILVMGSVQNWDFLTVYALGSKVKGVSASPSRAKQMAIIRQAMRVNCLPAFNDLLTGYWSIQNLQKLILKLNRSGCYRDLIFQNRENIHKKDLIWMERTHDAGFENDRPQNSEEYPSVEVAADGTLKEL